jgi:hypothetical protein
MKINKTTCFYELIFIQTPFHKQRQRIDTLQLKNQNIQNRVLSSLHGSTEFPDKSYNSFVVSVESLATFDKFSLYPYIINNKIENSLQ